MSSSLQEVPYIHLTTTQREKAHKILLTGARLLKKWAAYYHPKKFRQFRNAVMAGNRNPEGKIPTDRIQEFHADLPAILAIREKNLAFRHQKRARSAEEAVLESYVGLAQQHVSQWAVLGDPAGCTRNDYLQEAYMAIIEAMYQYDSEKADLTTFVWWSLRNRMITVTNKGNLLCPLTNADLKLVVRYDKAVQASSGSTFDEIVQSLGLSEKEGQHLSSLLTKVYSENQLDNDQLKTDEPPGNDYTVHRAGVISEQVDMLEEEEHVQNILQKANLTPMERKVLEQAMNPYHGWMTEFAKTHINPETGKSYSRMRITQLLEIARRKTTKVLDKKLVEKVA